MTLEAGGKFRATENITRSELVSLIANFVVEKTEEKPADNAVQYTVTFNTNGGKSISAVKVESGKTVSKPTNPTKIGYSFDGWYSDSGLTKVFDFNSGITADITLYAKWTKTSTSAGVVGGGSSGGGSSGGTTTTKYTVTFEMNGGDYIADAVVESGETLEEPETPKMAGYYFMGWYKDNDFISKYNFDSKVTKNITIYAKWLKEDPEKQKYVVDTMGELIDELDGIRFTLAEKEIVDIAVTVMQLVVDEAANGTPVYDGDYIIENYSDYIYGNPDKGITGARELYNSMEESDQTDFYSKLVTELGEERANQLLGILFGMNLEDAKDKIDN